MIAAKETPLDMLKRALSDDIAVDCGDGTFKLTESGVTACLVLLASIGVTLPVEQIAAIRFSADEVCDWVGAQDKGHDHRAD